MFIKFHCIAEWTAIHVHGQSRDQQVLFNNKSYNIDLVSN